MQLNFTKNRARKHLSRGIYAVLLSVLFFALAGTAHSSYSKDFTKGKSSYSAVVNTEAGIKDAFPSTYVAGLTSLLKNHPNWKFKAFYTGLDWEDCFTVNAELYPTRNLAYYKDASGLGITKAWYSTTIEGSFNWAMNNWTPYDSGLWYQASEEAIRYTMDPRNFLTETQIFQFMDGSGLMGANVDESESIILRLLKQKNIAYWLQSPEYADIYWEEEVDNPAYAEYLEELKKKEEEEANKPSLEPSESESESEGESEGDPEEEEPEIPPETIMVKHYLSYARALAMVCQDLKINETMIVSRLLQEQGTGTSPLISGTRTFTVTSGAHKGEVIEGGYYQYFNIGASGNSMEQIINNGLTEAYNGGWDTRLKSLYGGAKAYSTKYITQGQSNLYLQKYSVNASSTRVFWGQYMQNITAPQTEAVTMRQSLIANSLLDYSLTFVIPVFGNMPTDVSPKPTDNRNPNYKLGSIYVDGEPLSGFQTDQTAYGALEEREFDDTKISLNIMSYAPEATVTVTNTFDGNDSKYTTEKSTFSAGSTVYGSHTLELPLFVGENHITVKCTAENGTWREYTFSVRRYGEPKPGDVNMDGEYDIFDIAEMRSHILGYQELAGTKFELADLDLDGEITIFDIAPIRSYILGYSDKVEQIKPEPEESESSEQESSGEVE